MVTYHCAVKPGAGVVLYGVRFLASDGTVEDEQSDKDLYTSSEGHTGYAGRATVVKIPSKQLRLRPSHC